MSNGAFVDVDVEAIVKLATAFTAHAMPAREQAEPGLREVFELFIRSQ